MSSRLECASVVLVVGFLILPVSTGLISVVSTSSRAEGWALQERVGADSNDPKDVGIGEKNGTVELNWHPPEGKEDSTVKYRIYRSLDQTHRSLLTTTKKDTFIDEKVEKGRRYHYWVTAVFKDSTESSFSREVSVQLEGYNIPTRPSELEVFPGDSKVRLEWKAPSDEGNNQISNYIIHRKNSTGKVETFKIGLVNHYVDNGVMDGSEYTYNVTAKNPTGESLPSEDESAIPSSSVNKPGSPEELIVYPGLDHVELTWYPPASDGGTQVFEYRVYRNGEIIGVLNAPLRFYRDEDVEREEEYKYSVSAVNIVGESNHSTPRTIGVLSDDMTVPASPNNLKVKASPDDKKRTLRWDEPNSSSLKVINYNIYRSTDGENFTLMSQASTHEMVFRDVDVEEDGVYFYKIRAVSTKNYLGHFSEVSYGSPTIQERETSTGSFDIPLLFLVGLICVGSVGFAIALWMKWKNPRGPVSHIKEWKLNEEEENEENKEVEQDSDTDQGSKN